MTVRKTDAPEKVEVITSVQRRRRWNASEKMRMVEESLEPGASVKLGADVDDRCSALRRAVADHMLEGRIGRPSEQGRERNSD